MQASIRLKSEHKLEPTDGCIAAAVTILGKKWTALILRDLLDGQKGFCEIMRSVGNVNPRTLSQRLEELEKTGIVTGGDGYALTEKGYDLIPILRQMAAWGSKYHP